MWPDILGSVQIGTKVICDLGRFPTWECELEFSERSSRGGQWVRMGIEVSYPGESTLMQPEPPTVFSQCRAQSPRFPQAATSMSSLSNWWLNSRVPHQPPLLGPTTEKDTHAWFQSKIFIFRKYLCLHKGATLWGVHSCQSDI